MGVNGKRTFDPHGKGLLIKACRQPGASVAGLALKAGVNANQLRNWVALDEERRERSAAMPGIAFVPVVEVGAVAPRHVSPATDERLPNVDPATMATPSLVRLSARLPNGVTMELQCTGGDAALVAAMVKVLGAR